MRQNSIRIKYILFVGLMSVIVGCAGNSYHFYSGDHLPKTDLATIKPWAEKNFLSLSKLPLRVDVFPILIDGKTTETYRISPPSYFILPGEHTIVVALLASFKGSGSIRFKNPKPMVFQAKVGHTYLTKAYISLLPKQEGDVEIKLKTSFWVEDEKTKEVVIGTRLTE